MVVEHQDDRPFVSVLIAAYNTRAWIAGAIDSVLAQEGVTVEVLVIDDASTDDTAEFVQSHYQDPRVRLFRQSENRGPSAARNRGLREARGEWIAVLDADDWFCPGRLRRLLQGADCHNFDLVGDEQALYDDEAVRSWALRLGRAGALPKESGPWHTLSIESILDNTTFGILQLVVRREFLLQHRIAWCEDVRYGEDYLFLIDCMLVGGCLGVLDEPYYGVRIRSTSLTGDRQESQRQLLTMLRRLAAKPQIECRPDWQRRVRKAQSRANESIQYMAVLDHAKRLNPLAAAGVLLCCPRVWPGLARRVPKIIRDRYRRYASR